jgi:SAM-dependent methyltransferase
MPGLGWLDVSQLDFNLLLLLEPLHAAHLAQRKPDAAMGPALHAHPAVEWYLAHIHPPVRTYLDACKTIAPANPSPGEVRHAEVDVLNAMHDWLIYVFDPEKYDQLEFLAWDDNSLLEMADFRDKVVLDIGSGTGRLAFTVAPLARVVYAVEPVANLRRFLREKRARLGINNLYPSDGVLAQIPFEDDFADILMAGHVFGEDFEAEYTEMTRVVHDGGMILLHPGTNAIHDDEAHHFLVAKGFAFDTFEEPSDGLKRKYWITRHKPHKKKEHTS